MIDNNVFNIEKFLDTYYSLNYKCKFGSTKGELPLEWKQVFNFRRQEVFNMNHQFKSTFEFVCGSIIPHRYFHERTYAQIPGLFDKNNQAVYEGSTIVFLKKELIGMVGIVEWNSKKGWVQVNFPHCEYPYYPLTSEDSGKFEVTGHISDTKQFTNDKESSMKSIFNYYLSPDKGEYVGDNNLFLKLPYIRDCNNQPIYEGSIVKLIDGDAGVIKYNSETAYFYVECLNRNLYNFTEHLNLKELEVIGHIACAIPYNILVSQEERKVVLESLGCNLFEEIRGNENKLIKFCLMISNIIKMRKAK